MNRFFRNTIAKRHYFTIRYSQANQTIFSTGLNVQLRSLNRSDRLQLVIARTCAQIPGTSKENKSVDQEDHAGDSNKKLPPIDKRVIPIAISSLLMGTAIGVILPVMPLFAQSLDISIAQFGLVTSVLGCTRLIFNIPAAVIGERWGRKPLLVGGPILASIGMTATAFVDSLGQLVGARFLTGIGSSMQMTGGMLYSADISTPKNRARTIAPMSAGFGIGAAIGPAIGGYLCDRYNLSVPFLFVGSAVALVALNNKFSLQETLIKHPNKPKDVKILGEMKNSLKDWGKLLGNDANMRSILALHMTYWACLAGGMMTLMPLMAFAKFGSTSLALGSTFAGISVVQFIFSQPMAYLSDRFGRKKTAIPAVGIMGLSLSLMPFASTSNELMGICMLWALGGSLFGSNTTAFVSDHLKDEQRGNGLALLRSAGDLGMMLGAGLFGLIAHRVGIDVTFGIATASFLTSGAYFALRGREPKN